MQLPIADGADPRIAELKRSESDVLARLRANPTRIADYQALADIEIKLGDQPRALLAIAAAARLSPTDPSLAIRAAELHSMRANWRRAALEYERALRLGLRDARIVAALLLSQLACRSVSAAQRSAARLIREFPQDAIAWLAIGALRKAVGDFPGALVAYRQAVQLDRSLGSAWFGLIELAPPEERAACRRRLEQVASLATVPYQRANFEFARAWIHDASGDYEHAFQSYVRANAAAAAHLAELGLSYQPQAAQAEISNLAQLDWRPSIRSSESAAVTPIFIVGMPRSGSTLIEQMLSNHPDVGSAGEVTALSEAYEQYLEAQHGTDGPRPGGSAQRGKQSTHDALLARLRTGYLERLLESGNPQRFVTDKFPGNFRLLGFARQLFPEAPFLHCRRDPLATCWSIFSTNLTLHAPYHTSLEHTGHFYTQYLRLMAHWRESERMLEIDYERVIEDPVEVAREMLAYCGLEYDERCLRPQDNNNPVTTASAAQVRQPLYTSALSRWRNYEPWLQPLRESLR